MSGNVEQSDRSSLLKLLVKFLSIRNSTSRWPSSSGGSLLRCLRTATKRLVQFQHRFQPSPTSKRRAKVACRSPQSAGGLMIESSGLWLAGHLVITVEINTGHFQFMDAGVSWLICRHECAWKSGAGTWHHCGAHHSLSRVVPHAKPRSGCGAGWLCVGVYRSFGGIVQSRFTMQSRVQPRASG